MHGVVTYMKNINIAITVGYVGRLWPMVGPDGDCVDQAALAKQQRLIENGRCDVLVPESQQKDVSVIHAERLQSPLQAPRDHLGYTRVGLDDEAKLIAARSQAA